ncbi:MAG: hypothetical protein R3C68_02115 [Myxococcota bacterium]
MASGLETELTAGRGVSTQVPQTSVILSPMVIHNGSFEETIKADEAFLRQNMPTFRVISREPWHHPRYGDLPTTDTSLEASPGLLTRQVRVFFVGIGEKRSACLTLTVSASRFKMELPALQRIFHSIEVETESEFGAS